MLGCVQAGALVPAPIRVSAHANRVPVEHGHTVCMSIKLDTSATAGRGTARRCRVARRSAGARAAQRAGARAGRDRRAGSPAGSARRRGGGGHDGHRRSRAHRSAARPAAGRVRPQHHSRCRRRLGAERRAARRDRASSAGMIVVKFGGTSVGDAAAIERAAEIVRGRLARRPLVVVSALAGTTNTLLGDRRAGREGTAHRRAARRRRPARASPRRRRRSCSATRRRGRRVAADLSAMFDELASLAEALSVLGHMTPRSLDAIASIGERLSSHLVVAVLCARGIPAQLIDAGDVMITDDQLHARRAAARAASPTRRSASFVRCSRAGTSRRRRIRRRDGDRHHHDARSWRQRLQRRPVRRRAARRGDRDLDRCRRHAHRGSARRGRRTADRADPLRRGVRAGIVRREGPAPEHDRAGRPHRHPGLHLQLAPPRGLRNAHHVRRAAAAGERDRRQARRRRSFASGHRACCSRTASCGGSSRSSTSTARRSTWSPRLRSPSP